MRLINTQTFELKDFGPRPPLYAILSHTWREEEVTFQDMSDLPEARKKKGFAKIERCCRQALRDGFDWAWVDTCCIDKTSSAELSETINSMYQWYERAMKCYAFFDDVFLRPGDPKLAAMERPDGPGNQSLFEAIGRSFRYSRWWTRGWTLQELIAPLDVEFYNFDWERLTSKRACKSFIKFFTGIALSVLDHSAALSSICAAERISWASSRRTTREEDMAYCLLGILDVNMPLLYGEGGRRAFQRLQEQFIAANEDYTLFLWGLGPPRPGPLVEHRVLAKPSRAPEYQEFKAALEGILAGSPGDFRREAWSHWLHPKPGALGLGEPLQITSRGLRLSLFTKKITLEDRNELSRLGRALGLSSHWRRNPDRWLQPGVGSLLHLGAFPTPGTGPDRLLPCLLLLDTRGFSDLVRSDRSGAIYARVPDHFYSMPMTEVVANLGWDFQTCYLKTRFEPEAHWYESSPKVVTGPGDWGFWIWRMPGPFPQSFPLYSMTAAAETRQCAYFAATGAFPGCLVIAAARSGGY